LGFEWNHIDYPPGPNPVDVYHDPNDNPSYTSEIESFFDQGYVEGYSHGAAELEEAVLGWLRYKSELAESRAKAWAFRYVLSVIEREAGCEEGMSDRYDNMTSDNVWWYRWTKAMRLATDRILEWNSYQG
jgi:hypothetical protein